MIKLILPKHPFQALQYDQNDKEVFEFVNDFYRKYHPYADYNFNFTYRISDNSTDLILEYVNENGIRIIPDCSVIIKPLSWIVINDPNGLNGMEILTDEEFNNTYKILE